VVAWGVALAADVGAVEASVPTLSTARSWWGRVMTVLIDAIPSADRAGTADTSQGCSVAGLPSVMSLQVASGNGAGYGCSAAEYVEH
jgi:hypothetical protein